MNHWGKSCQNFHCKNLMFTSNRVNISINQILPRLLMILPSSISRALYIAVEQNTDSGGWGRQDKTNNWSYFRLLHFGRDPKYFLTGLGVFFNWEPGRCCCWIQSLEWAWRWLVWQEDSKFINHSIYHCVITIITSSISQDRDSGPAQQQPQPAQPALFPELLSLDIDINAQTAENAQSHLLTTWEPPRSTELDTWSTPTTTTTTRSHPTLLSLAVLTPDLRNAEPSGSWMLTEVSSFS